MALVGRLGGLRASAGAGLACLASSSGVARLFSSDALAAGQSKELVTELQKTGIPTITAPVGQAFPGDLRATSGLGLGDGLTSHTSKWLQVNDQTPMNTETPMEFIAATEPIKVKGNVVASYGTDDPALGCPVEYINLKGTSRERPAVCKYTGNKYYSDDWRAYGTKE